MKIRFLLLLLAVLAFSGCIDYSDGERSGVLIKFSKKGIFTKTWEGSLNLGGLVQTDKGLVPNVWEFSIDPDVTADQLLVPDLQKAIETGSRINITYKQEWAVAPWRAHSEYFAKAVKFE